MRRYRNRRIAGACGCCLVPFVILLIAFIAAVAMTSMVWHAAMPKAFMWGHTHRDHFDSYRSGFEQGQRMGQQYATRSQAEPAVEEIDELASREAERLHIRRDRREWTRGFRDGFARGFESFNKQASVEALQATQAACCRYCVPHALLRYFFSTTDTYASYPSSFIRSSGMKWNAAELTA